MGARGAAQSKKGVAAQSDLTMTRQWNRRLDAIARSGMHKIVGALCLASFAVSQATKERTRFFRLDSMEGLETINTKADIVMYRGRKALHLAPAQNHQTDQHSMIALVNGTDFKDGTIEVQVAGLPIVAMDPTARGFVGVEFRAQEHGTRAENIYLRPTNGRADEQLRALGAI